jgi:hypothetical protein
MKLPGINITGADDRGTPGAFWYVQSAEGKKYTGLGFMCPCGCGERGVVLFYKMDNHPAWNWDGNIDKPTLTPSIQRNTACRWHGFLTAGEWITA